MKVRLRFISIFNLYILILPCLVLWSITYLRKTACHTPNQAIHWKLDPATGVVVSSDEKANVGLQHEWGHDDDMEWLLGRSQRSPPPLDGAVAGKSWWVVSEDGYRACHGEDGLVGGMPCSVLPRDDPSSSGVAASLHPPSAPSTGDVKAIGNSTRRKKKEKTSKVADVDCGPPVNNSVVDTYEGVILRYRHFPIETMDVLAFYGTNFAGESPDFRRLARKIQKQLNQDPQSPGPYVEAGLYWRQKRNASRAIDCYRKALNIDPNHSEALLHTARVLMSVSYLHDAAFIARRSIVVRPVSVESWRHQFTLGEILKTYGHLHDSIIHFRQTLMLKPDFRPAREHLSEVEGEPLDEAMTSTTMALVLGLALSVWYVLYAYVWPRAVDDAPGGTGLPGAGSSSTPQRHFNRAMAMKSMKASGVPGARKARRQPFSSVLANVLASVT